MGEQWNQVQSWFKWSTTPTDPRETGEAEVYHGIFISFVKFHICGSILFQPIDSQHPDRNANVQICIACWLTEEEYQEKKAEHMLAWQDGTPPRQGDPLDNLSLDITVSQQSYN